MILSKIFDVRLDKHFKNTYYEFYSDFELQMNLFLFENPTISRMLCLQKQLLERMRAKDNANSFGFCVTLDTKTSNATPATLQWSASPDITFVKSLGNMFRFMVGTSPDFLPSSGGLPLSSTLQPQSICFLSELSVAVSVHIFSLLILHIPIYDRQTFNHYYIK